MRIVNIVATGCFESEINLHEAAILMGEEFKEGKYSKGWMFPTYYGTVTIYPSGKFIVAGAKSEEDVATCLKNLQFIGQPSWRVVNVVGIDELGFKVSLERIAPQIEADYDPELTATASYRAREGVINLHTSGKMILAGFPSQRALKDASRSFKQLIESIV